MPLSVMKQGTADVPALFGHQQMQLQNLRPDSSLTNKFLKLTLYHDFGIKWVGTAPRRKVIFLESGPLDDQKINAFFVGALAKEFSSVSIGDSVFLANVTVQKSATFGGRDMVHPCQLVVSTDKRPDVWVIPNDAQPSTSSSTTATNSRTTGLGTTGNNVQPTTNGVPPNNDQQSVLFKELYNYQYTPLKDMKATRKVDVYGVVKFFKPPYKSAGPDYCMVITIVDPSIDPEVSGFRCLIFNPDLDAMPQVRDVGDVIRFHRLKVVTYNDGLQGQKGPGFSCLVFDGSPDAPIEARSTTANFTLSELDKVKVKELREWASRGGILSQRSKLTLSGVAQVQDFDLVCQVIAQSHQPDDACVYLKVWDGTRCKLPLSSPEDVYHLDDATRAEVDRVDRLAVDICVNGQHVEFAKSLQPGDFVRFYNLSAVSEGSEFAFVLAEGTSHGRGLIVLSEVDDVVRKLSRKLETAVEDDLLADDDDVRPPTDGVISNQAQNQVSTTITHEDPNTVTLSKVRADQYFDLTCQVIKVVEMPETSCICINVWDGTKMTIPCREIDYANLSVSVIPGLVDSAGTMAVDVCLYDNHMQKGRQIKAGGYVKVTNLHSARFPPVRRGALVPQGGGPQMVELALHKGTSFGKGVEILWVDDPSVVALKRRLLGKAPPAVPSSAGINGVMGADEGQTTDLPNGAPADGAGTTPATTTATKNRRKSAKNGGTVSPAKELRCMQQFASFTIGCECIKFVTIDEAKSIPLPSRFRVRARVTGYLPKDVRDFVHMHCLTCNHRCGLLFLKNCTNQGEATSNDRHNLEPPASSSCRQSPRLRERVLRDQAGGPEAPRRQGLRSSLQAREAVSQPGTRARRKNVISYREADSSQESTSPKLLKRNFVDDGEVSDPSRRLRSSTREAAKRRKKNGDLHQDDLDSQTSNDYWTASDGSSQGSQTASPVFHQRLKFIEFEGKYGTLAVNNLTAEDVLSLCRNGLKLSQPPTACLKYVPMSSSERGKQFVCPNCCPDTKKGSKVLMNFEYFFKLTVTDDTGSLEIIVKGDQAETFLCGLEAENLYTDNSRMQKLTDIIGTLCKGEDSNPTATTNEHPQLECCIKGETVIRDGKEHKVYQLVSTQLSNDLHATVK